MFTIVQFSPTGNTAYIAHRLSESLKTTQIHALEHTVPDTLVNSEHLVLLFPIHGFNAPKTVLRFVKALPKDKFRKVSLIGVGCNDQWMNHGASLEIRKILTNKSYPIIVDETLAMPLTMIMRFPDDVVQAQIEKVNIIIPILANHILNGVVTQQVIAFKSRVLSKVGKIKPVAARFFGLELQANKNCTQCGLCVKECPERNIKLNDRGKLHFGFKCMMCLRCIYHCPQKSIAPRISKFIPIKNGYSIKQFIEAN